MNQFYIGVTTDTVEETTVDTTEVMTAALRLVFNILIYE